MKEPQHVKKDDTEGTVVYFLENLKLHDAKNNVVHSIPRGEIGIPLDFGSLTSLFIEKCKQLNWLQGDIQPENDLYFKEDYMVECAYLLWGYNLKQAIKKIS